MEKITTFIKWFPVLPFILYWIISFIAHEIGPFVYPVLSTSMYIYFFAMLASFIIAYRFGLKDISINFSEHLSYDNILPLKILNLASILAFIGTLLFVIDRITSGAGSFDLVMNDMIAIRERYADSTTWITTVAVLPQSFKLIAFAAYFYCLMNEILVKRKTHLIMFSVILLDILNMILSSNRGSLFWYIMFSLFYIIFCKRITLFNAIFSRRYKIAKIFIVFLIIGSISYFYFVARNRTVESTLKYLGMQSAASMRYPSLFEQLDYASIGATEQLFSYITHEFDYADAFLKNAEVINFEPLVLTGMRVQFQIQRIFPDYVSTTKDVAVKWLISAGLSPYGWPSIFGWPLAAFGILGAVFFFPLLGFICGRCVLKYLKTNNFGWFLLVFVAYHSLNMSFDWILRDFDQYAAIILAIALINRKQKELII